MGKTCEFFLKNLVDNSGLSARQLGIKLGLSTVTVLSRIKKLEKIIKGYTILYREQLGYSITATIKVITRKNKILNIENKIPNMTNVCKVYDTTENTDTIVAIKFKNKTHQGQFSKKLFDNTSNMENIFEHLVLNTVKKNSRLT